MPGKLRANAADGVSVARSGPVGACGLGCVSAAGRLTRAGGGACRVQAAARAGLASA